METKNNMEGEIWEGREDLQKAFYGESANSTNKDQGHNPLIPLLSQQVSSYLTLAISFIV